jgi:hypothetical protein
LKGFLEFLNERQSLFEDPTYCYLDYKDYYSPAYYVMLASSLNSNRYIERYFDCHPNGAGYLNTIGFQAQVFSTNSSHVHRVTAGKNYSPLVKLASQAEVDSATTTINSCIRQFASRNTNIDRLCHVVGELHDNVWAHGNATGYSMAQKWKVPYSDDHLLEFGIADSGLGFLAELQNAQIPVTNDMEAINWCIQEGNSTKIAKDDFAQALPQDYLGAVPASHAVPFRTDGSHHQGLGLHHLIALVNEFNGELHIFSGDCRLHVKEGKSGYHRVDIPWQGVAISCRFRESCLNVKLEAALDVELMEIMKDLV